MPGERARRLIIFGNDGIGNEFGWDPLEATDPEAPEFAIFALYRRAEEATRLADSFRGFVGLCLESGHYHPLARLSRPRIMEVFIVRPSG